MSAEFLTWFPLRSAHGGGSHCAEPPVRGITTVGRVRRPRHIATNFHGGTSALRSYATVAQITLRGHLWWQGLHSERRRSARSAPSTC